jgi:hypothetical protein
VSALTLEPRLFESPGAPPTLDQRLVSAWDGLIARSAVECPVCGGAMEPEFGAQAWPIGGRCQTCGSTLA